MWLLLAGAAAAEVLAAAHHAAWTPAGITWTSTYQTDGTLDVRLAAPLPVGAEVEGATVEGDVLHLDGRRVVVRQRSADRLRPPLADGAAVQRVTVEGALWQPDPALGMEQRILRNVDPSVSHASRRAADRLDRRPHAGAAYLVADARFADGLPGELRPTGDAPPAASFGAALAFVALLGGLAIFSRWKPRRTVDLDAYMREEFVGRAKDPARPVEAPQQPPEGSSRA